MKTCKDLIALARAKVHTDRALADLMGIKPPDLSAMKSGQRPVSPETAIKLCEITGITGAAAQEWIAIAVIENPKNASLRDSLKRVLFQWAPWSAALGVVLSAASLSPEARASQIGARTPGDGNPTVACRAVDSSPIGALPDIFVRHAIRNMHWRALCDAVRTTVQGLLSRARFRQWWPLNAPTRGRKPLRARIAAAG